ncbi:MAG: hypothetical protein IJV92_01605, partial [Phascolarctobacterium sp.]|nr:hypothetical protein [Phascolarctobacterium sp.]
GDKLMTRYEMAQIVAKAMAKGADCDKLAAEFADELDTLGVRVAKLEKKADNVKITGETRLRYWNFDNSDTQTNGDKLAVRTRIWIKGQVNEDWSATAMLENTQTITGEKKGEENWAEEDTSFQRAYVNGKVGGLAVQAGRYSFCDALGGLIYDDRVDGIQVSYGKYVKITAAAAKATDKNKAHQNGEDMAYVELATKLGLVDAKAAYYKVDEVMAVTGPDVEVYAVQAGLPLAKDLKLAGTYLFNETDDVVNDDDGYVVALNYKKASASKPGSWALWAKYYDQPSGTFVAPTFEADDAGADGKFFADMVGGFEGYGVGVDYAIAKNIVAQVKYYDLEAQDSDAEREVIYGQINFSF